MCANKQERIAGPFIMLLIACLISACLVCFARQSQGAEPTKAAAAMTDVRNPNQAHPVPDYNGADQPRDTFGHIIKPDTPELGKGLDVADVPKFAFGAGIFITVVGLLVKLGLIAGVVTVAIFYIKHRTGAAGVPKLDPVDALIAAFTDLTAKVVAERDKKVDEIAKLNESLGKLKKGVNNAVSKE